MYRGPPSLCLLWLLCSDVYGLLGVQKSTLLVSPIRLFSTKPHGFGTPSGSSSSPKKGFAGKSSGDQQISLVDSVRGNMEATIQMSIDAENGLRECMNLTSELDDFSISMSARSPKSKKTVASCVIEGMEAKKARLTELEQMHGWNDNMISKKLHELTWDASAQFRDQRHQSVDISYAMESHMSKVAKAILEANIPQEGALQVRPPTVLDVGAGTGILMKFLLDYTSSNPNYPKFRQENLVGIDLSTEMIKICQSTYPRATYFKGDFMEYTPTITSRAGPPASAVLTSPSHDVGSDPVQEATFDAIVFNESLHHFQEPQQTLAKALSLTCTGGRVIISHPRGFDNVFVQQRKNKWLTPSLLPSEAELSTLAAQLGADVTLSPKIKSAHYLAVLTRK